MRVLVITLLAIVSFASKLYKENERLKQANSALRSALKSLETEKSVGGADGTGRWLGNLVYEGIGAVYCGTKYCTHFDLDNCKDARNSLSVDKDATDLSGCPSGWEKIDSNYWGTACGKPNWLGTYQYLRLCKRNDLDGPQNACVADCLSNTDAPCSCCSQKCSGGQFEECAFSRCGDGRAEDQVSNVLFPTVSTQTKSMSKKEVSVGGPCVDSCQHKCGKEFGRTQCGVKAMGSNNRCVCHDGSEPLDPKCWPVSSDGVDLADKEWTGHGGSSLDDCIYAAAVAGVDYFAWNGQLYGGYCKVLNRDITSPNLNTDQGYGYKLYKNAC